MGPITTVPPLCEERRFELDPDRDAERLEGGADDVEARARRDPPFEARDDRLRDTDAPPQLRLGPPAGTPGLTDGMAQHGLEVAARGT